MVRIVLRGLAGGQRAVVLLAMLFACPVLATAQESRVDAPIPHVVGQSVSPSFEGWYLNPDGTRSLLFGYFNRNYEEKIDIPVGLNNQFTPGPADRGQPTHFLPRRQTGMFAVVVPPDFEGRLTWSLTAYGETIAIPGHLRPEWEITALEEITSGNTPPVVRVHAVDGDAGQGPGGTHAAWTATVAEPAELVVWAVDDGVRKVRASERPPRFGLVLSKYRGPGAVSFEPTTPDVDSAGQAVTLVTFDEPGEYVLRVLAWDDSGGQAAIMAGGFFCCWTNAYITVQVQ
ncbi:MAG: hypothetical protein VX453_07470 [Acidobacteriota bacterium]|nr:hypothetical protein [Acidobacteriota bacterium]